MIDHHFDHNDDDFDGNADGYGGVLSAHLSVIFIGRFSLLSIKEEEVYHLF